MNKAAERSAPTSVLVVDDEEAMREVLRRHLERDDHEVHEAATGQDALTALEEGWFDLVLTDLSMAGMSGLELLTAIKAEHPELPVVVVTGYGTIDNAIQAMKAGAEDFLQKPFQREVLRVTVDKALRNAAMRRELDRLRRGGSDDRAFHGIIGVSQPMRDVFDQVRRAAATDSTVLVRGDTGTGKEMVARALHRESDRRDGPFVAVDCSGIPESLMESTLFGHAKGAFTGADRARKGLFEEATEGTLFLDEINNLTDTVQVTLLRVLQEREVRPVGAERVVPLNVRLVCATNVDLERAVSEGRFREDLFYRINVVPITLPTLDERPEDIPLLVLQFAADIAERDGGQPRRFTDEAVEALQRRPWPGNVRQLRNVVEHVTALCPEDPIPASALPAPGESAADAAGGLPPATGRDLRTTVDELVEDVERREIERALHDAGGNRTEAAELLGISRGSLYNKLERYGLDGQDEPEQENDSEADAS